MGRCKTQISEEFLRAGLGNYTAHTPIAGNPPPQAEGLSGEQCDALIPPITWNLTITRIFLFRHRHIHFTMSSIRVSSLSLVTFQD
ncbi:hypothetical protein J6590_026777 [Homalodisca vitripennis]|nr:hypothetical protein J6590_026777 [Homalodisca vitripennis]